MSQALRRFDAMEVVPVYQSCIVIVGVSWGWLFYAENKGLSSLSTGLFVLGCSLSIVGIAVLSLRPVDAEPAPADAAAKDADQPASALAASPISETPAAELRILAPAQAGSPASSPQATRGRGGSLRRQPSIYGSAIFLPSSSTKASSIASPSAGSAESVGRSGSLTASTHMLLRAVSMSIHALHAVPPDGHVDEGGDETSTSAEAEEP